MSMANKIDGSECVLLHTVMAARVLTRRYDDRLRPFGVTLAQFFVLATVSNNPGETVSALADRIAMDRTTLSRNLALLEQKGLVARNQAARGNARTCELTPRGADLLSDLVPHWRTASDELSSLLRPVTDKAVFLTSMKALIEG